MIERAPHSDTSDDGVVAFVDESMRTQTPPGVYVVAAAVLSNRDEASLARQLRQVVGQRRRAHWHRESEKDRLRLLDGLAVAPLRGISVAVTPVTARRQEKARESALWSLLAHLEPLGVAELVLESRQEQLNRRDRRTIWSIQRAGIGTGMRYRFARPSDEVGLWAADVLAGAVAIHVAAGVGRYVERLPDELRVVHRVVG